MFTMNSMKKEPSSAPPSCTVSKQREQNVIAQRRRAPQDPCSDPTGRRFHAGDLDSLSDEQLKKLTKANTRKNHGGRSSRLRSQVERVFRRLDNLAADVKLQPRYSIEALPLVSPDDASVIVQNECTHAKQSNAHATGSSDQRGIATNADCPENKAVATSPTTKVSYETEQKLDPMHFDNEEFEIEPATNNSTFTDYSSSIGVQSGLARSVRISTSVTILDYKASEPVSISRLQRCEHPTRTGKCLQTRRSLGEKLNAFPRATQRFEQTRDDDDQVIKDDKQSSAANKTMASKAEKGFGPSAIRVRSAGPSPVSFIVPTPSGPYRSRSESNHDSNYD